ncbi:MAG TPA: tetratricopeptide repeat protein [Candidatus Acidoferrales bacterium]|nr:tetratricopeptide repeat protein [Candidatus Acidoferrales bacterium]
MVQRIFRFAILICFAALCGAVTHGRTRLSQTAGAPRAASSESRPDTLLIFPFQNDSKMANLDWLGEGLSELTAERFEDRGVSVLSREDRLATLEKMGLPDSARFSHATIVKIATEADADAVIFGRFQYDGQKATLEARVLRLSPPSLSAAFTETSSMDGLLRAHARLTWKVLCAVNKKHCPLPGASLDESSFSEPPPSLPPEALENFIRGVTGSQDEERMRLLREAARLEPTWDRPAFELGRIYFKRKDCDSALVWYSRVPPNRPDGPEASFATGVCHLARNDATRAEATFSGLLERTHRIGEKDWIPEVPEMHNNLGVSRLQIGKWNEAETEFERASNLDPEEADYWINIAIAKIIGKQAAAALTALEHARKIDPDDKEARAFSIATLESLGRGSEAAPMRAEATEKGDKQAIPNLQDGVGLARMSRVSRNFDRTLLRPGGEAPEGQSPAGKAPRKPDANGTRP